MPAKRKASTHLTAAKTPRRTRPAMRDAVAKYIKLWIEESKPDDPVFGSTALLEELGRTLGRDIQPFEHCVPEYFPNIAERFGLQRYIPSKELYLGRRGPSCWVDGKTAKCHSLFYPSFMYLAEDITCSLAASAGHPTVIWRYGLNSIDTEAGTANQITLFQCWYCYSKVETCPLGDKILKELEYDSDSRHDGSSYSDVDQPQINLSLLPSAHIDLQSYHAKLKRSKTPETKPVLPSGPAIPLTIEPATPSSQHQSTPRKTMPFSVPDDAPPIPSIPRPGRALQAMLLQAKGRSADASSAIPLKTTQSSSIQSTLSNPTHSSSFNINLGVSQGAIRWYASAEPAEGLGVGIVTNVEENSPTPVLPPLPMLNLVSLRTRLEHTYSSSIQTSRDTVTALTQANGDIFGIFEELATTADNPHHQATMDRQALVTAHATIERVSRSQKVTDSRLAEFMRKESETRRLYEQCQQQEKFIQSKFEAAKQDLANSDHRFAAAVEERDQAFRDAAAYQAERDQAVQEKEAAHAALLDAYAEVDEIALQQSGGSKSSGQDAFQSPWSTSRTTATPRAVHLPTGDNGLQVSDTSLTTASEELPVIEGRLNPHDFTAAQERKSGSGENVDGRVEE